MKKIILSAAIALLFASCEGPVGPMGPMGPQGRDGQNGLDGRDGQDGRDGNGANWSSFSITVDEKDWILKGGEAGALNSYYAAYKKDSRLTDYIFRNGSVIAYLQTDKGVKNGMPFVLHKGQLSESGDREFLWTETYDFDFTTGEFGFFVTYSDFSTNIARPGTETFHIVLYW